MNILALDIASKTGWATKTASGVWDFRPKRDESGGMRLIRFKSKLKEIIELESIDLVVVEQVAGRFKKALITLAEMHGVFKEFCENESVEYRSYAPSAIKKHATGKGNSSKVEMVAAAKNKWSSIKIIDDNHADALYLYDLACDDLRIKYKR